METLLGSSTFIVRVSRDDEGHLIGIVERTRTGQKERFHGVAGIGPVIARMLGGDADVRGGGQLDSPAAEDRRT
jgi:hypothetical protein